MPQMESLFKALADTNRLRIINILERCDLCVCDLQSLLGLPQPFISRHLAYLRRAGLVKNRREGAKVCYSLSLDHALANSVCALLRAAGKDSLTFQSDLRVLNARSEAGQLKTEFRRADEQPPAARAA